MNAENDTFDRLQFTLEAQAENSSARACAFKTLHNTVQTPVFMPVATFASLRTQTLDTPREIGYPVLLANTYHLLLRPGPDVFRKIGGIHRFMNWDRSVLTDSGGFQIFSLSQSFTISEDGARFRSYVDGKEHLLSPESSIDTQKVIGSDIMMVLDQCISSKADKRQCRESVDLTAHWAERSLAARGNSRQALFGIIQGACFPDLRKASAERITAMPFDGYAIGGLAVGESEDERKDITEYTAGLMPVHRPRYLMGVGTPIDLLEAVHRGIDMFDCIMPTAMGQQGIAYTSAGKIELRRGVYKFADAPLDAACDCPTCNRYSKAYLHHLVKSDEYYGGFLISQHNLTFYHRLMREMRSHILEGTFRSFYNKKKEELILCDEDNPKKKPARKRRRNRTTLGTFRVVRQKEGGYSIHDSTSGETMHSVNDPTREAKRLYIDQSDLRRRLGEDCDEPLVIWDVGLGTAANAMAAVHEIEFLRGNEALKREVTIVSFEDDLDALRLVLKNPALFPHVRHAAPVSLLKTGRWGNCTTGIKWILADGDFKQNLRNAPVPDIIYYDMFSFKTDDGLWSTDLFKDIFVHCGSKHARLITYSASAMVRAALLAAGFSLCYGPGSGPKTETTIAFTSPEEARSHPRPFGKEWLAKWERNMMENGEGIHNDEKAYIYREVLNHPQFAG